MSTLRTALALVVLGSAGLGVQSVVAQTEWGLIAPGYENARQRYEYYDPGGRSTKNSQDARRILDLVDSAFPPTR